ncbi:MAG TPA: hypothetical protein VKU01_32395 [Bryobacteraceae bacterium]|nr:hypothetical protein [Bryobacteraceae bacterium]
MRKFTSDLPHSFCGRTDLAVDNLREGALNVSIVGSRAKLPVWIYAAAAAVAAIFVGVYA